MTGGIAAETLRQYVDRIERLKEEIKALIAERAKEPQALKELEEILDLYRAAVNGTGIAFACAHGAA